MGFLTGKKILITGLLSNRSIAYGIAAACYREGASLAFTYVDKRFKDRITQYAHEFDSRIVLLCDVAKDDQILTVFKELNSVWESLEGIVHSIAFAPRESISGDFLEGLTRENFRVAHEISTFSFPAMAKAALPMLKKQKSALLTLSYLGAERAVPNYNVMGLAKSSLEASIRYLAASLGPHNIRVNGISAGPIRTLASSGIKDFSSILNFVANNAPLRRNITTEEIGNIAAFMLSDLASGITGETIYADCGFSKISPFIRG